MLLALDFGTRYIGVAITDPDERFALRHSVVDQKQANVFAAIKEIVKKEKISTILVGVPISLSGNESQQTRISRDFITKLKAALPAGVNVAEADETLTSVEADKRIQLEGGRKEEEHTEAARIILDEYLQRRSK